MYSSSRSDVEKERFSFTSKTYLMCFSHFGKRNSKLAEFFLCFSLRLYNYCARHLNRMCKLNSIQNGRVAFSREAYFDCYILHYFSSSVSFAGRYRDL